MTHNSPYAILILRKIQMKKIKLKLDFSLNDVPHLNVMMHHTHKEAMNQWAYIRNTESLVTKPRSRKYHLRFNSSAEFFKFAESVGYGDSIRECVFYIPPRVVTLFNMSAMMSGAIRKTKKTNYVLASMNVSDVCLGKLPLLDHLATLGLAHQDYQLPNSSAIEIDDMILTKLILLGFKVNGYLIEGVEKLTIDSLNPPDGISDRFHIIQTFWVGNEHSPIIQIPVLK